MVMRYARCARHVRRRLERGWADPLWGFVLGLGAVLAVAVVVLTQGG